MARLNREAWVDAAYESFSSAGITAVAVEPVARALGSTKGSFYWHFTDRQALVDAVLQRWADLETEGLIAQVEHTGGSPAERLATLFTLIAHRTGQRTGERTLYADAAASDVHGVVMRVTERRVSYVASLLEANSIPPAEARRRATVVVSAVIGFQQLIAGGWDAATDPRRLIETLHALATSEQPGLPEAS